MNYDINPEWIKEQENMAKIVGEMTVTDMVEHEDGSATLTFDMDAETTTFLVNYAIVDIIKKQIALEKSESSEPFEYDNGCDDEQP